MVGNRPRGRPKGSKLKKNTSRATESAIQGVLEEVHELITIDKAEQHLKKQSYKGMKNQPLEQLPEKAEATHETR